VGESVGDGDRVAVGESVAVGCGVDVGEGVLESVGVEVSVARENNEHPLKDITDMDTTKSKIMTGSINRLNVMNCTTTSIVFRSFSN
jgi:hypothetical protein